METEKKSKKSLPTFDKESLVNSKRYKKHRDVLNGLLKNDKRYTADEVDKLINSFLKKGVK